MNLWIAFSLLATLIYLIDRYLLSYWSRRGIPQNDPTFLFGNLLSMLTSRKSIGEFFAKTYRENKKNKVMGLYMTYRTTLIVNDPQLVNDVLIRHFNNFHDRGFKADEKMEPLSAHLFLLNGQQWRDLRVKMSPTFTSGKLKGMYPAIQNCAEKLQDYVERNVAAKDDIFDVQDLLARFTTSVISSVAFGIENDCVNEPDNIFRQMGMKHFQSRPIVVVRNIVGQFAPWLLSFLKIKIELPEVEEFFYNVVRQTVAYREASKANERKDFMQLLIELKNKGFVAADKNEKYDDEDEKLLTESKKSTDVKKLTFNEIVPQAFLFFVAGFETSSSTMNFCLYELSKNQNIQKKIHDEIDKVCKSGNVSEISYDVLSELKYLECCVDETLRKYPIVPILNRQASKDYTFTGTNLTIEKGTNVVIPILGMQRDPDIFENPMEFKPERFLNSTHGNGKVEGLYYLPFGDGPRNCIGARMGKLQAKLGLATVLAKFRFEFTDKSMMNKEIEFDPKQFIITPKERLKLRAVPR